MKKVELLDFLFGKRKGWCGLFRCCDYDEVGQKESFYDTSVYIDKKPIQRKLTWKVYKCKNCGYETIN